MTTSTKVNSFTILKTKNQFILLCWKKNMAYVHQLLDQPSQWQTSQQAGPCSVPKFTNTSITVKHLLIKNKNINQSKSSLLIWHYVSYLFLFIDLIASQVIVPCQTFYPPVNLHVFWPKATSNDILPLCHCLCPVVVLCNYVTVYLEICQMSSKSTFTLSSDTFD